MGLSGAAPASGAQIAEFNTLQGGGAASNLSQPFVKTVTGIADSVATAVATLSVPNLDCSVVFRILVRSMITANGHNADSSRVVEYFGVITRQAGAVAVITLSAAVGAAIATKAAGQTITTALAAAAVVGAAGAVNTFDLQITNAVSVAGISETTVAITLLNSAGGQVSVA